jgi:hypothetical protein
MIIISVLEFIMIIICNIKKIKGAYLITAYICIELMVQIIQYFIPIDLVNIYAVILNICNIALAVILCLWLILLQRRGE